MEFSERLWVPASWWVAALFFGVSFATAIALYLGPAEAMVTGLVAAVLVAGVLLWFGSTSVSVDAQGLRVGRAALSWEWLGEVSQLDRAETAARIGPEADHAGYFALRGYVPTAVEVEVTDPSDPHPRWLVSTRRPAELAAALEHGRATIRR